jgi:hypothetical protein
VRFLAELESFSVDLGLSESVPTMVRIRQLPAARYPQMMWIRLRGINLHRLTRAAFFEQLTIRPEQPLADASAF